MAKRKKNPSKAETGLLSFKFLATAAGLYLAWRAHNKKDAAAQAQLEAAAAQKAAAEDPIGAATKSAQSHLQRFIPQG